MLELALPFVELKRQLVLPLDVLNLCESAGPNLRLTKEVPAMNKSQTRAREQAMNKSQSTLAKRFLIIELESGCGDVMLRDPTPKPNSPTILPFAAKLIPTLVANLVVSEIDNIERGTLLTVGVDPIGLKVSIWVGLRSSKGRGRKVVSDLRL